MNVSEWLNSQDAIEKSRKSYAHFDYRTDIQEQATYISNPEVVAKHGFLPFIHYQQKTVKYDGKKKKEKIRDLFYASHVDGCIFRYYNFVLNELYNRRIISEGLSDVAVAYRTDLHLNNIDLAKRAFGFIKSNPSCYIMIGDFTSFFDNLDHQYLKSQWCSLLDSKQMPKDHYAVFKNITKYSSWELTDLLALNGLQDNRKGHHAINSRRVVLTKSQFAHNRSHITKNHNAFGIPQGSPMSALLANIYMLDIDKQINEAVKEANGMYMRYSDDFIIILLTSDKTSALSFFRYISTLLNETAGLKLEESKTQYFRFADSKIINYDRDFGVSSLYKHKPINFLGFSFDGKKVSVRQKTIFKYYHHMYRKAKTIVRNGGYTRKGKHISCKNLYRLYSIRGSCAKDDVALSDANGFNVSQNPSNTKHQGNFLSYIRRAEKCFGPNEAIGKDTRRHMQKIRKALKKRYYTHKR